MISYSLDIEICHYASEDWRLLPLVKAGVSAPQIPLVT